MQESTAVRAAGAEDRAGRPAGATGDGPPLSIGLFSAGWPPDAYPNGIVTYVAVLAEALEALGHRVTIFTAQAAPGDWGDRLVLLGPPGGRRGPLRRAADWLWYRAAPATLAHHRATRTMAAEIARVVAERGIQVLEMEESFGDAELVRQAVHIPVTLRLHGPFFLNGVAIGAPRDRWFRWRTAREEVAVRRARSLTSPSLDVLERTRGHYGLPLEHAEVIPNPIPPVPPAGRWRPEAAEPATICFVGRFDRHKGGDLIIEAFGRILRSAPEARLLFVGPDWGLADDAGRPWDVESFVDDRLPGARGSGRVRLLGHQPRSALDDLRRRASVVVVCSRYENFPVTVLEAAAVGCPIVAARVGGIPEIVRDGLEGLLHRPEDPDDLADKILAMLADPARAAELGRRAAARCEQQFHPLVIAGRMVDHFRRTRARADALDRAG